MSSWLARAPRKAVSAVLLVRNSLTAPPRTEPEPLVTVILATYNWSSVLRHAVRSVLAQTHENFELLVVGDACTDDSEEVVRSFADPRVRWENLSENSGSQSGPNNRGLSLARGELIAYQGHDDVWHPYHLATLVDAMTRTDADVAWTVAEVLGPPGTRIRGLSGALSRVPRELGWWIPPCTIMHRRDLADRMGPWPDWREVAQPVDVELEDRAQLAGARMVPVPALTAFKFPSVMRPNSYREKPSHEQAEYLRRIESRRGLRIREIGTALARRLSPLPERPLAVNPNVGLAGKGDMARLMRRIRGLD